jgi:DNA invertase Pin-like site-specific DNA recombinase
LPSLSSIRPSDFAELVLATLGISAELERRRIVERTARGRADAKAKGVKFGRKPSLTPHSGGKPANAVQAARRNVASPAAMQL